jgi:S1-C subfamily serine protease
MKWTKKMKMIRAALVAAIALATFTTAHAGFDQNLQKYINNVVQINDSCSASVILSDRDEKTGKVKTILLTAKHCVDDRQQGRKNHVDFLTYQNNRVVKKDRYLAEVKGTYYKADLALLELDDKDTLFENPIPIAARETVIALGDETVAIGYPFSMGINVTFGHFQSIIPEDTFTPGQEFIRSTPDVGPGNSGGALLRKVGDKYELIGVTTAVIRGFPFTGLFTGRDDIRDYLNVAVPELAEKKKEEEKKVVSPSGR